MAASQKKRRWTGAIELSDCSERQEISGSGAGSAASLRSDTNSASQRAKRVAFWHEYLHQENSFSTSSIFRTGRSRLTVYVTVMFLSLLLLATSAILGTIASTDSCNMQLPNADNGFSCCDCICNINDSKWCNGTVASAMGETPSRADYHWDTPNGVDRRQHSSAIITTGIVTSCIFLLYQMALGIKRGNMYTLLFVTLFAMYQSWRGIYVDFNDAADASLGTVARWIEFFSFVLSCLCIIFLFRARERLSRIRFAFFGIATRKRRILQHYELMFAFALMDWQVSATFCVQCTIISESIWVRAAIIALSVCDMLSLYLAYLYVRYERIAAIRIAIIAKSYSVAVWVALVLYYYHCFADYKALTTYLRALVDNSVYLMIDVNSAVNYTTGTCALLPSISTTDEALYFLLLISGAIVLRFFSCYYALMLSMQFDEGSEGGVIKSLFFDVAAAREARRVEAKDFDNEAE